MTETVAMLLLYLAAALVYGADSEKNGPRLRAFATLGRIRIARSTALAAVGLAGWLWHRVEPGPAAFMVVAVGLMANATVITLTAPSWPRLVWGATVACIPAIALLTAFG